jgi:hypothetical protein
VAAPYQIQSDDATKGCFILNYQYARHRLAPLLLADVAAPGLLL